MKMRIEVECTPVEARQFMGLPDVTVLNEYITEELKKRTASNLAMMGPDALMKSWMQMGLQTQEAFMGMLNTGARGKQEQQRCECVTDHVFPDCSRMKGRRRRVRRATANDIEYRKNYAPSPLQTQGLGARIVIMRAASPGAT